MTAIEWGTAGEWASAIGTTGALVVAGLALAAELRSRKALESRLDRERRQEDERQARRVSFVTTPYFEGHGADGPLVLAVAFEVENESDRTITDLLVEVNAMSPSGDADLLYSDGCKKLAPGGRYGSESRAKALRRDADLYEGALRSRIIVEPDEAPSTDELDRWVTAFASFTDADGRRWETTGAGALARADPV